MIEVRILPLNVASQQKAGQTFVYLTS